MYESQTYAAILQRMLDRVPADLDKREGSVIYDALAPAAAELAQAYVNLDLFLKLGFAATASGEWLDKRAAEQGVTRKQATPARREGIFNVPVTTGARFFIDGLYFVVMEGGTAATLECETDGTRGNRPNGTLLPVDYIDGLSSATLGAVLVPGTDTESDESLRERLLKKVRSPATSGNMAHYLQWAKEVAGVGGAKVFPMWNGPGTIKVVIVNSEKKPASAQLAADVAAYIESVRPIGANVTVVTANAVPIHVTATITLSSGYVLGDVQSAVTRLVNEYIANIVFKSAYISYAKIGSLLLDTPGIADYRDLRVNGTAVNVEMAPDDVPVSGKVELIV
ncbi:baseplate J/gp47 family protein [Heliophilum fasciatum]|uniref:Putative phage protein gp47/JayE n=1 Tax=Heliophilum fasciatum TaxID=35700 RepID=A0A4R2RLH6_9FIRM|nr:baseplate J/gp47 family protein [Heliophilum fasciatum]MCW2277725.1 putative phage protein gp47/JayE [Heliophilum fasciatum]TCP64780.1 putative phage protein gp47/JayE [Heliophilum fasciatum]